MKKKATNELPALMNKSTGKIIETVNRAYLDPTDANTMAGSYTSLKLHGFHPRYD
jgi:hypothetical protein